MKLKRLQIKICEHKPALQSYIIYCKNNDQKISCIFDQHDFAQLSIYVEAKGLIIRPLCSTEILANQRNAYDLIPKS